MDLLSGGNSGSVNFYFFNFKFSLNSSKLDLCTVLKKVDSSPVDYVSFDGSCLKV